MVKFPEALPGKQYHYLLLTGFVILYIVSVIINLGYLPLNGDEPKRAVISLEMLHSGNFVKPTIMGTDYYNKPPLYNWFICLSMWLTGSSSEEAVRLPSLLAILCWGLVNYLFVRKHFNKSIAVISSLFLMTSLDMFFWGLNNGGEIDIFFSFLVYLQIISIFHFNQNKGWLLLFCVSYFFAGMGFLTKGFPSIVFQGLTFIATAVFNKSFRFLFSWQHIVGLIVFFLVAGSYFYVYSFYGNTEIYIADLLKEAFNKSAFGEHPDRFIRKVLEYPFSFLKILMPWSLLLLLLIRKPPFNFFSIPLIKFSLYFIAFNLPVYWFTGHPRMRYAYMFIPFCMIILAYIYEYSRSADKEKLKKIFFTLIKVLYIIGFTVLITLPFFFKIPFGNLALTIILYALFLFVFIRAKMNQLIYAGIGIIILRFVFVLVFLPLRKDDMKLRYDVQMSKMAESNNYQPATIYTEPTYLDLEINLKLTTINFGTIPDVPYMAYEMPYYYYRKSGQFLKYDTVLKKDKTYIGFLPQIEKYDPIILYSYKDPNQVNQEVALFKLK